MTPPALVTSLAAALLVGGALLLLAGPRLPHRPRGGRSPSPAAAPVASVDAALALDLVAAVVEAGAAPLAAVSAVGRVLAEAGAPVGAHLVHLAAPDGRSALLPAPAATAVVGEVDAPLRRCLQVAEQTGAPVVALLRAAADEVRRRRRRAAALAAARLGVRVVAPLGLCTLPAFALLAVLPVLLSLGRELLG